VPSIAITNQEPSIPVSAGTPVLGSTRPLLLGSGSGATVPVRRPSIAATGLLRLGLLGQGA
jgi:hypothetical protein